VRLLALNLAVAFVAIGAGDALLERAARSGAPEVVDVAVTTVEYSAPATTGRSACAAAPRRVPVSRRAGGRYFVVTPRRRPRGASKREPVERASAGADGHEGDRRFSASTSQT